MNKCPYINLVTSKKTESIVQVSCKQPALSNGWCETHQYCHDTLERLRRIGYARLQINDSLEAGGDSEEWRAYIITLPAPGEITKHVHSIKQHRGVERYAQLRAAIAKFEAEKTVSASSEILTDAWIVTPRNRIVARL